jgi:hypothetical protein
MNKQTEEQWITRAEAAKRLKVSAVMVGKYVGRGLPTRSDKRIPWPQADAWVKTHIHKSRSGNFASRTRAAHANEDVRRSAKLEALNEITSTAEMARFARVALRMGCTPEQAYMLSLWFASQATLALTDIDTDEIPDTPEPDWEAALGKKIDFKRLDDLMEQATAPEVLPELRDRSLHPPPATKNTCAQKEKAQNNKTKRRKNQ